MSAERVEPADSAYLAKVIAEIEEEVKVRRAQLPARLERELDELFLTHSPLSGRGGDMGDALRLVDASVFIDPVVPVASNRRVGSFVKSLLRKAMFWYVGFVAHQVSTLAAALSRSLHIVSLRLDALDRAMPTEIEPPIVDAGSTSSWWVSRVVSALGGVQGRIVVLGCGDGWLVEHLSTNGIDAYGIDPRSDVTEQRALSGVDVREDSLLGHLEATGSASLAGVVVTGVVEGMSATQRTRLLSLIEERLAPGGVIVVRSLTPEAWLAPDAPPAYDLAPGHPLRPSTWPALLGRSTSVEVDPGGIDYLVVARG